MISVIVISYNAERTIARCIDSILGQTYRDFELIIINDGSSDGTVDIIRKYSEVDSRIRIHSRSNKGVAYTRQEGLDMAVGEYSIFVDADDWVEPDFLESLYRRAVTSEADMVMCDMLVERRNKTEYLSERPKSLDAALLLGQMINELHGSLCNKLISKDAYLRTGTRFLPDLDCCEDQYVVIALLSKNISVSYIDRALYHYDKTANEASITNNWLDFPVKKRVHFIKSIEPYVVSEYQRQCYSNYIGAVAYTATASSRAACPNYRELFGELLPYIKQAQIPAHKKIISCLRLMGIVVPTRLVKLTRRYFQKH